MILYSKVLESQNIFDMKSSFKIWAIKPVMKSFVKKLEWNQKIDFIESRKTLNFIVVRI